MTRQIIVTQFPNNYWPIFVFTGGKFPPGAVSWGTFSSTISPAARFSQHIIILFCRSDWQHTLALYVSFRQRTCSPTSSLRRLWSWMRCLGSVNSPSKAADSTITTRSMPSQDKHAMTSLRLAAEFWTAHRTLKLSLPRLACDDFRMRPSVSQTWAYSRHRWTFPSQTLPLQRTRCELNSLTHCSWL